MTQSAVLSVRVSPKERLLLESAALQARSTLSDFIRRKAVEAAEAEMMDRRTIAIPAGDWARFEAWIDAPAKTVPALRKLAAHAPKWQD